MHLMSEKTIVRFQYKFSWYETMFKFQINQSIQKKKKNIIISIDYDSDHDNF